MAPPSDLRAQLQSALGSAYVLERELGGGGMSRVYVAQDTALGRAVVVKVLAPELAAGISAERFAREVRLAARLQQANIVPVLSAGVVGGLPYYIMPFVEGLSLRARLGRGDALPISAAVGILRDVARALAYAHASGVVHRDVKPENVLLSGGTAVVTDFGIAKALTAAAPAAGAAPGPLTATGMAIGTPAYMAPEQAAGDAADHRADLYAWGVVAYELLAGRHPFADRTTARALIGAHLTEAPVPISVRRPDVPPALAALVMACLEKDAARRPQTADALVAALQDVGTSPKKTAASPRRRRALAAAPATVVIATVVIATGGALFFRARGTEAPATLAAGDGRPPGGVGASRRAPSLAVLPLANRSGDPAQDYFADGMTDELTTTLGKLEALRVIAHRSVLQFRRSEQSVPEIARLLGVAYVVDGSVLQDGNRVRINAALIDAATNTPVWTERFERERRDVLALQREVALAIAHAIEIALTPQDRERLADAPAVDPAAFDFYVKGTQARHKSFGVEEHRKAMAYLERAVAADSTYAPAYSGLASLQAIAGDEAGARRSADKALALDPRLAEAHMVLGMIRQFFDWDWTGAESALREAIRLNPGHAEAHHELSMLLMRLKRFDEALREARYTVYLAPMSARFEQGVGEVHLFSGRSDEALGAASRAIAFDSTYTAPYFLQAYAYTQQGKLDHAAEVLAKCMALACGDHGRAILGYVYAVSGRRAEARQVVDTLSARWTDGNEDAGIAFGIAQVYAGLGQPERALDWLERGVETGSYMVYLGVDPLLHSLHGSPRFQALLTKLGLPE